MAVPPNGFELFDTASLEALMTALLTLMDSDGCDMALVRPLFNQASAEHANRPDRGTG